MGIFHRLSQDWTTWMLFFFCVEVSTMPRQTRDALHICRTFHLSSSSCFALYCLTRSSSTFFRPSELVVSAGRTSLTVCSIKTPLMRRKALRSPDSGCRVSNTSLSSKELARVAVSAER